MGRPTSNRGVGVVIGGGIALGLALAIVYATVIGPRGQRAEAAEEIEAWTGQWTLARRCLTGDPRSTDPVEAIAARELVDAQALVSMSRCRGKLGDLRRKPGFTSQSRAIESAWDDVGRAVRKLGVDHALHTAKDRQSTNPSQIRVRFGEAIAGVDAAAAGLRRAAELEPMPAPGRGKLAAARAPVEVKPGLAVDMAEVTGNVVLARGATEADGELMVRLTGMPPRPDNVRPLTPAVTIAASDTAWGIRADQGAPDTPVSVTALALDARGTPADPGALVAQLAAPDEVTGRFALGDADRRVALFHTATGQLVLARSGDAGATWTTEPLPGATLHEDYARRRADLILSGGDDGLVRWLELRPDLLDAAPRLLAPENLITRPPWPCAGPGATWWDLGEILLHAAPGESPRPVRDSWLADGAAGLPLCDDDQLIALIGPAAGGPSALQIVSCSPAGCSKLASLSLPDGSVAVATLANDRLVVAVHTAPVLAVWTGSSTGLELDRLVRIDLPERILGIVDWNRTLHVVDQVGQSLRIIALPDR